MTDRRPRRIPSEDDALLEEAARRFQHLYDAPLTREDAREIVGALTGVYSVLRDWERAAEGRPVPFAADLDEEDEP